MASRATPWLFGLLSLGACGDDGGPGATGGGSSSSTTATEASGTRGATTSDSSTGRADTTTGPVDSSSGPSGSTSTGTAETTSSEGSSGSTGEPRPANGCADGEREALTDEVMYPDIAACSGGWEIPGVLTNTPYCRRQGGDDGPNPVGERCSVEDLCSEDWHVCEDRGEVMAGGIAFCDDVFWGGAFFVTRQSGEGSNTCDPIGLNDVFGCGNIGFVNITGCEPLNRGSANLCEALPEPWLCPESPSEEAEFIRKTGPQFGGALCCRD